MGEYADKTKGKLKQAVGSLTGDKRLKREGEQDERKGQAEGVVASAQRAVKGVQKDAKHALKELSK